MSKNYNKRLSDTSARIGEVRFSYAHVFEKYDSNGDADKAKYSACLLIPKSDTATVNMIRECIAAAEEKGKASKWGGKIPAKRNNPLRDGDEEEKGGVYEGMYFMNTSSTSPVGVRVLDAGKVVEALDSEDFYSGCWGAASVNFFPYDSNGNKGVGVGLNNVIKTRDDERLSGGSSAEADFGDMGDELD